MQTVMQFISPNKCALYLKTRVIMQLLHSSEYPW